MDRLMSITFKQYVRPHGRPVFLEVRTDSETDRKADKITERGMTFECNTMSEDTITLNIYDPRTKVDVASTVCTKGDSLDDAVAMLVENYYSSWIAT